jgi:hypothetical protein
MILLGNAVSARESCMRPSVDLIVPNLADFNLRGLDAQLDPIAERRFHTIGSAYGDQAVFWSAGPRIVVLHPGHEPDWLDDLSRVLHEPPPLIVAPPARTGRLLADLLASDRALAHLLDALGAPRQVRLMCFGATPEIYALAATVRARDHDVVLDVPPEDRYWTTTYLDSKLCCADLATALPGVRVPPGWTVSSWRELRGVVDVVLDRGLTALVKAPYGVGRAGCLTIDAEHADRFWPAIGEDPFFRTFPMLVQERVEVASASEMSGIDVCITDNGVDRTVTSIERRDGAQCCTLGPATRLLPTGVAEAVAQAGGHITAAARAIGYRGWLGADLLPGADGALYLIELNARRTGGMHAVGLLTRCGRYETAVSSSRDAAAPGTAGPLSYVDIRPVFERAWRSGEAVYPSTVRGLSRTVPLLGVAAVADDADAAGRLVDGVVDAIAQPAAVLP